MLSGSSQRIADLTAGLTPAQLRSAPGGGEWSANDVLAHLRACSDVWGGNMQRILSEDKPTYKRISPRAWIKSTDYLDQEFKPSLRAFASQRAALLAQLETLPPRGWSRTATVIDVMGKRLQRTVLGYADALARHEGSHLEQMERIVNMMRSQR